MTLTYLFSGELTPRRKSCFFHYIRLICEKIARNIEITYGQVLGHWVWAFQRHQNEHLNLSLSPDLEIKNVEKTWNIRFLLSNDKILLQSCSAQQLPVAKLSPRYFEGNRQKTFEIDTYRCTMWCTYVTVVDLGSNEKKGGCECHRADAPSEQAHARIACTASCIRCSDCISSRSIASSPTAAIYIYIYI